MKRMIPVELLAEERIKIMVDSNIQYAKALLEAGVDPDTVIDANATSWAAIGSRTGGVLKPIFKGKPRLLVTDELGAMTREMYGMTLHSEPVPEGREITITHCPWRKRVKELPLENPHRFCRAGHRAFLNALTRTLHQDIVVEMDKVPPGQEEDCCITVHLFPETKVGRDQKSED